MLTPDPTSPGGLQWPVDRRAIDPDLDWDWIDAQLAAAPLMDEQKLRRISAILFGTS